MGMVYLDYAAATPVRKEALDAMLPFFSEDFFNPSSPYLAAKRVREKYENAKSDLAHTIGAKSADLIVTSGATEANNLAFTILHDDLPAFREATPSDIFLATNSPTQPRVLALTTEHASVRELVRQYHGDFIKVDKTGLIDLADFRARITDQTELISISLANNELGIIQPLAEISEIIKKVNQERHKNGNKRKLYLHSDASQALNLIEINVARLGVDLLTLNSPKVYGPKGVGALYIARGTKLTPINRGGGQELGLRSGTENVPGVIGFATAAKLAKAHLSESRKKYLRLTEILKAELAKAKITPIFLGNHKHQLTNFCPVSFPGIDAERLIYLLEDQEIYLSTGAACAASKGQKSHVLEAIGLSDPEIAGSLRISLGLLNTEENTRLAAQAITSAVNSERSEEHTSELQSRI